MRFLRLFRVLGLLGEGFKVLGFWVSGLRSFSASSGSCRAFWPFRAGHFRFFLRVFGHFVLGLLGFRASGLGPSCTGNKAQETPYHCRSCSHSSPVYRKCKPQALKLVCVGVPELLYNTNTTCLGHVCSRCPHHGALHNSSEAKKCIM